MVIIDAGHGGSDPGGGSNDLFKEKDLALKISLYQYNRFKELGIPVELVRNKDVLIPPSKRSQIINDIGKNSNNVLISNHINRSESNFSGSEIIYSFRKGSALANKIKEELEKTGRKINRVYYRKNSAGNDYYFIIRDSLPNNPVIVEYGFADNYEDSVDILNNYEKYAEAVVKAVAQYLGYDYSYNNFYYYTVKKNDSLYKISNKTGIPINEIKEYNNLKTDNLKIDQTLKIPYRNKEFISYMPYVNENLRDISHKFESNIEDIKRINGLTNGFITEPMMLKIPLRRILIPYVVKPGDSLYKIAVKTNNKLGMLIRINNLENAFLNPGDVIYILS